LNPSGECLAESLDVLICGSELYVTHCFEMSHLNSEISCVLPEKIKINNKKKN